MQTGRPTPSCRGSTKARRMNRSLPLPRDALHRCWSLPFNQPTDIENLFNYENLAMSRLQCPRHKCAYTVSRQGAACAGNVPAGLRNVAVRRKRAAKENSES